MNQPDRNKVSDPRPKKAEIKPHKPVYIYHWNRIFWVIGGLLGLLAVMGYGMYAWLSTAPSETPAEIPNLQSKPANSQNVQTERAAEFATGTSAGAVDAPEYAADDTGTDGSETVAETPVSQQPTEDDNQAAEASLQQREEPPTLSRVETDTAVDSQAPAATQEAATSVSTPVHESTVTASNQEEPADSPAPDTTPPTASKVDMPFRLLKVRILASEVERFLLPQAVVNKEPRGELEEIRFTKEGAAAVWCYSEVIGKRGSRLRYVWFNNSKRIARVQVAVGGNRWRSYSSKIINQRQQGVWRVELQDAGGRQLAWAEFELR